MSDFRSQPMSALAPGCCSAATPCNFQKEFPGLICDVCHIASLQVRIQELEGTLKLAEYVSRKDSLSEHERLASARTVICRALQPKDGAK
jgi:hypothetical protein